MRWLFFVAGLLCLLTGAVHAIMGGIDTLNPVMASAIALEARTTMMAVWHIVTLLFGLSVLAFFWAFRAPKEKTRPLGAFLGLLYLFSGIIFCVLSFLWFEDPMALPQWTLLAPIGLFSLIASI